MVLTGRRLTDPKIGGSRLGLGHRVVSIDKELYSTLSLFTVLDKWLPATQCWGGEGGGGNLAMN